MRVERLPPTGGVRHGGEVGQRRSRGLGMCCGDAAKQTTAA